jgi:hypothetical protein
MVALGEQPRRFLARGKLHRQIVGQAAAACPLEEVTHSPAGGGAVSEPCRNADTYHLYVTCFTSLINQKRDLGRHSRGGIASDAIPLTFSCSRW